MMMISDFSFSASVMRFFFVLLVGISFLSVIIVALTDDANTDTNGSSSSISSKNATSIFHRGTANVQWCEDVLARESSIADQQQRQQDSNSSSNNNSNTYTVAEYYNTISNAFFVIVALHGLWKVTMRNTTTTQKAQAQAPQQPIIMKNKTAFFMAELIMMVGVGIGSVLFHAHQSRLAQYSDEFPMCCLLLAYKFCLKDVHPLTSKPYATWFYGANVSVVAIVWMVYVQTGSYEVFVVLFSSQVLVMSVLSYSANTRLLASTTTTTTTMVNEDGNGTKRPISRSRSSRSTATTWYWSAGCLVAGKLCWELERHRYDTGTCDAPGTLLLHPLWHLLAAISHHCSMQNLYDLERNASATSSTEESESEATAAAATAAAVKKIKRV
jgi:hypothetical protein